MYWHKDRQTDHEDRLENPETILHILIHRNVIYCKWGRSLQRMDYLIVYLRRKNKIGWIPSSNHTQNSTPDLTKGARDNEENILTAWGGRVAQRRQNVQIIHV